jgi:hypothetical protein
MNQSDVLVAATQLDVNGLALLLASLSTKLTTLKALNAEVVELTPEALLEEVGRPYSEKIQRTLRKALKPSPTYP